MANRRMFSLEVCDTDRFMEMPLSTQGLYLQLGLRADDDGFISSPKRIVAMVGGSNDDLKLLIAKGYLIPFESGIIVITDWNINNWIRPDRKHNTRFEKEKALLALENGSYSLDDICQPNDNQMTIQCHTEVSIDKYSIDNINNNSASPDAPKESNAEIESFFESIWKLYPNKKGKAAVSKTKKKELFKVGYDEMSRAISRYVTDLKADEWRKPQYGSSFFNKGYVDYLDKNYTAAVASDPEKGDRSIYKHDYEELKRELGID
nr:MAG TPA: replisome organizer protein [Bacteriophage sp.]